MVLGVQLRRVVSVVLRMQRVGLCDLRVVRGSLVASALGVLTGDRVVLGSLLVVFGGFGVVVGDRVGRARVSLQCRGGCIPSAMERPSTGSVQYARTL